MTSTTTTVLAGIAANNATLFHRVRFIAPDAAAIIDFADGTSVFIVRDIEMDRARKNGRADRVCCAADYEPKGGLSGDRDTALAQAAAECLRRAGETSVTVDRTLPYLYAHFILRAGIEIAYSEHLGVEERRIKKPEEIEHLRYAQRITGEAMSFACRTIAKATPDGGGILYHEGGVLSSERVRSMITAFLIERDFSNTHDSIVVTAPHVADCHHFGAGPLKANLPVIVDIFPMDNSTRYHGTGHGIGLEVHEPILLDHGGGRVLQGEVFTVEPGLYSATLGGVRVEDMVAVTAFGHEVLSPVHEGLDWNG